MPHWHHDMVDRPQADGAVYVTGWTVSGLAVLGVIVAVWMFGIQPGTIFGLAIYQGVSVLPDRHKRKLETSASASRWGRFFATALAARTLKQTRCRVTLQPPSDQQSSLLDLPTS
jgi:hypothetical protein